IVPHPVTKPKRLQPPFPPSLVVPKKLPSAPSTSPFGSGRVFPTCRTLRLVRVVRVCAGKLIAAVHSKRAERTRFLNISSYFMKILLDTIHEQTPAKYNI